MLVVPTPDWTEGELEESWNMGLSLAGRGETPDRETAVFSP